MKLIIMFADRWPLIFRSLMYFLLGSLPVLYTGFEKFGKGEEKSTGWFISALFLSAIYEGLIALRAYHDGSAQRINDAIATKKANGFDTQQITKQDTTKGQ